MSGVQNVVVGAISGLFSHGPNPLEHTLDYPDDPGLLGPNSISWQVLGDVSVFVGGVRALLVQAAHPEVVAGVEDHSEYRTDPLGRLSRTAVYVTETTYGARPEVEAAVSVVRKAHRPVRGVSERGNSYSAAAPPLAAWVHNVLTDSFLAAYQSFGPSPLTTAEADEFVREQAIIGSLLGADPLPETAAALQNWIVDHPELVGSEAQQQAIRFLVDPPLSLPVRTGYKLVLNAAATTIPNTLQSLLGIPGRRHAERIGKGATSALRWSLGASPAWHLALVRCNAPIPDKLFRQRLPDQTSARLDDPARVSPYEV